MEVEHLESPFEVFPEEIWEMIMERVDDSEDVLSVLQAFPEFRKIWDEKLSIWLIGAVMSLIFPIYLNTSEVKVCRQVSKRWSNAVDMILKTHPDRLPYKSNRLRKLTETHFNYHRLPNMVTDFKQFCKNFHDDNAISAINENPFPGGCVHFIVGGTEPHPFYRSPDEICVELIDSIPALEAFGYHISSMTYEITRIRCRDYGSLVSRVVEPLFNTLSHLHNLKSLKIRLEGFSGYDVTERERVLLYEIIATSAGFPFHLETLDLNAIRIGSYSGELYSVILSAFANHDYVEKLGVNPVLWEAGQGSLFPNLTELCLHTPPSLRNLTRTLRNILGDLEASRIKRLQMITQGACVIDILEILAPYQIESIELIGQISGEPLIIGEKASTSSRIKNSLMSFFSSHLHSSHRQVTSAETSTTTSVTFSSIESLRLKLIPSPQLGFHFLKSVPSLKYLTIDIIYWAAKQAKGDQFGLKCYTKSSDHFVRALFGFDYGRRRGPDNFLSIWNELPSLRMFRVNLKDDQPSSQVISYQYVRECNRMFSRSPT